MLQDDFSPASPGELVPVEDGWAFIPAPLPPSLAASWAIHTADERARGALGELVGQARKMQSDVLITRPLLTREAVESNKIENTITRASDVLLQEAGQVPGDLESFKDNVEVLRYQATVNLGADEVVAGRPLSVHLIRSLHEELLRGTRGAHRNPGSFRQQEVLIGREGDSFATARFVPPPWEHVAPLMDQLAAFIAGEPVYSPLISLALMHYQLETVHPFLDGNGRIGRLLMPLYLLAHGVMDRPLLYLSPFLEERRDEYIGRMKRVSTHGEWDAWVLFVLTAVQNQAEDALRRVSVIVDLHDRYREAARLGGTTKASLLAVDFAMEKVIITAQDLCEYAHCSYNTARSAIDNLVTMGVLEQLPASHPQRWWAKELIDSVYQT